MLLQNKLAKTHKTKSISIFLWIFLLVLLPIDNIKANAEKQIIINEIAWMGNLKSSSDEWIELYNLSREDVNLDGWVLEAVDGVPRINLSGIIRAQSYFLLERTDDNSVPEIQADLIYTGALSNAGEVLYLKDANGKIIDNVQAGNGWPAGDNNKKLTMEYGGEVWQNSLEPGGTPGRVNSILSNTENEAKHQKVVSDEPINNNQTLTPEASSNSSKSIDVIDNPKCRGAAMGEVVINEFVSDPTDDDVEWIELYNNTKKNINLENWTIEDASGAKTILSRQLGTGQDSRFFVIEKPKGKLNNTGDIMILRDCRGYLIDRIAYGREAKTEEVPAPSDPYSLARKIDGANTFNNKNDFALAHPTKGHPNNIISLGEKNNNYNIIISELMPNPAGSDKEEEFIELYNNGHNKVNLFGWILKDLSKQAFVIKENLIIKPSEYIVFWRPVSHIALNNSGDEISLWPPESEGPIQIIKYKNALEGFSYSATGSPLIYFWTEISTPGQANIIKTVNHKPIVDFDCPQEAWAAKPIIFDSSDTVDADGDKLKFSWDFGDGFTNSLPIPEHTFFHPGTYTVKLTVSDGQSSSSKEKIIKINKLDDSRANFTEERRLDAEKRGISIRQSKTKHLESDFKIKTERNQNNKDKKSYFFENKSRKSRAKKDISSLVLDLEKVKEMSAGSAIKTHGLVISIPGQLSSQYFYIGGSQGIQVYNYHKDFPQIKVGDFIEVAGELSFVNNEARIKTKKQSQIKILDHKEELTPRLFNNEELNKDYLGELAQVAGEVVSKKGSSIYLDDGTDEIKIYIKKSTGIKLAGIKEGDNLRITGIVSNGRAGLRILPRDKNDIIKEEQFSKASSSPGKVLGAAEKKEEWSLPARSPENKLKYFLVLSGGLVVLLGSLLIKEKMIH